MIGKLTGEVELIEADRIILNVGGVGYLVLLSSSTTSKLELGTVASLLIETYVREDLINLYGFSAIDEKYAFNMLTTVSGVGPRMALAILSHLSVEQLTLAIARKDQEAFKRVSGVGPKIAERIILELKNKTGNLNLASTNTVNSHDTSISSDALSALVNLGINRSEAYLVIQKLLQDNPTSSLNDLIRLALQIRNNYGQ